MLLANVFTDTLDRLTDWLHDVASNWWFVLIIFGVALLDSVIPVVPSETTVILGGVAAGISPWLAVVIAAGALGAFIGDNLAYVIGRRFAGSVMRFGERRPKFGTRLLWANDQIRKRGGPLLITARFIPGGRTALTISCGLTRQPRRWFAGWIAIAAVVWATYAAMIGAVFGERFADDHTLALVIAFGAAFSVTLIIELVRWLLHRRQLKVLDTHVDARVDAREAADDAEAMEAS